MLPLRPALRPAVLMLLAVGVLTSGCGATGAPIPQRTVTVTRTTGSDPAGSPSPAATTDVRGRAHDLGTISSVATIDGVPVIEFDRWSAADVSDSTVAREGIPLGPHQDDRYTNQNSRKTYTVPVSPSALVVVNVCVPGPDGHLGMTAEPVDAADWLRSPDSSTVLLLNYDADGTVTRIDTDPHCR